MPPTRSSRRKPDPPPREIPPGLDRLVADLKAAREAAGLSLSEVSERTGLDPASISKLENLRNGNPTAGTLIRYANAVGRTLAIVEPALPGRRKATR